MTPTLRSSLSRGITLAFAITILGTFNSPAAAQGAGPATIADTTTTRVAENLLAPESACPGQLTVGASRSVQAAAMFCLHEYARGLLGLESHRLPGLNRSAKAKSKAVMRCQQLNHACGRFGAPRACGRVSENLAYGSRSLGTPRQMMLQWLQSDHHRSNLLNAGNRAIGIGVTRGRFQGRSRTNVWAAHFGSSC